MRTKSMNISRMLPTRRRFLVAASALGLVAGLGLTSAPDAQAEAFGRVYRIDAALQPTALVAGNTKPEPINLVIKVTPNWRHGRAEASVSEGSGDWRITSYKMRIFLKAGPGGGSDNGTLDYLILANVSHKTGDTYQTIYARSHGTLQLANGSAEQPITSKYFEGKLNVSLLAPNAGW